MVILRKDKILDCITFFDNNFMFDLRYNILKEHVDYLINYDKDSNSFYSLANYSEGVDQQYISETKGVNTKYNINFAIQFKENFY